MLHNTWSLRTLEPVRVGNTCSLSLPVISQSVLFNKVHASIEGLMPFISMFVQFFFFYDVISNIRLCHI